MSDESSSVPDYVVRLDAERRREIDSVKTRMEDFLKSQIELKVSVDNVSAKQDVLKERFEVGTARTLRDLDDKFDTFLVEWGEKKSEDKARDLRIESASTRAETAEKKAEGVSENFKKYLLLPVVTICSSLALAAIIWIVKNALR